MEFDAIPVVRLGAVIAENTLCEEEDVELSDIGGREVLENMPRKFFVWNQRMAEPQKVVTSTMRLMVI